MAQLFCFDMKLQVLSLSLCSIRIWFSWSWPIENPLHNWQALQAFWSANGCPSSCKVLKTYALFDLCRWFCSSFLCITELVYMTVHKHFPFLTGSWWQIHCPLFWTSILVVRWILKKKKWFHCLTNIPSLRCIKNIFRQILSLIWMGRGMLGR